MAFQDRHYLRYEASRPLKNAPCVKQEAFFAWTIHLIICEDTENLDQVFPQNMIY